MDVNRAVEEVNTIPMFGFISDIVAVSMADLDPIKISVIINITFFLLKLFYFFLYYSLSFLGDCNILSWSCSSVC